MWAIETHATIDFETYSEAGFVWDDTSQSWKAPTGAPKKGIGAVGTVAYAEHPTTEVITMSYRLPGGELKRWQPGKPPPQDLFDHIAAGGLVEAHNWLFEFSLWRYACRRLYGWPELPMHQMRCSAAKARVNNLPGALDNLTAVLPTKVKKNPDGKRLINKFSVPLKPSKKQPATRVYPHDDPEDAERFYAYCDDDVRAEEEASALTMPMSVNELRFWQLDQKINWRGVGVDRESVRNMIAILEQAQQKYGQELIEICGLLPTQTEKLKDWINEQGYPLENFKAETVETALEELSKKNDPSWLKVTRALEIRQLVGSASVKKLYSMDRSSNSDNRVRGIIMHHGARTGRPTGELVQPLNLAKAGPDLIYCGCGKPHARRDFCPWCAVPVMPVKPKDADKDFPGSVVYAWPKTPKGYSENPVDHVQTIMATRSLEAVEYFYGDALLAISGSIRGMIEAGPGKELIASDYSAIEAVVTAVLSGCKWRVDLFKDPKADIYLASSAKIRKTTLEWYEANGGKEHPDRQKIGKPAELGLGFGGWIGAWRQFDKSDTFTDEEVKENIIAWRAASPEIVEMWGGQQRREYGVRRLERFGFEGAFVNAVQYPTQAFSSHGITFYMRGDALIIRLLSGRELTYHSPRLWPSTRAYDMPGVLKITYQTWNSNQKYGPVGWVVMDTYAGRIAENIVQATAHDIQRFGIEALEAAGYPIVLHVYDEDIAEVPEGWGSLDEFEAIMSTMPPWAAGWPVRASGGWRGRRYRKG